MVDNWSIKFLVPVIFFPHLLKMGPAIDYCVCISFIRLCFFVLFCFFLGGGGDIINVVLSKHWCKLADTCYHFMMWYKRYWNTNADITHGNFLLKSTVTHLHQDALNRDCLLFIWWNLGSCYNSVHLNCDV